MLRHKLDIWLLQEVRTSNHEKWFKTGYFLRNINFRGYKCACLVTAIYPISFSAKTELKQIDIPIGYYKSGKKWLGYKQKIAGVRRLALAKPYKISKFIYCFL